MLFSFSADEELSDVLQKVTLNLIPHTFCNESYFDTANSKLSQDIVNEWQICAGEVGKDTCQVIYVYIYPC